jgi:hypothetical protein
MYPRLVDNRKIKEYKVFGDKMIIHTLEARTNILLDVVKDYFHLSYEDMGKEIRTQYHKMLEELNLKGINYQELKNILTPQKGKKDICLVFDTTFIDDIWYGNTVFEKYFPLLSTYSGICIFDGDFVGSNENQRRMYQEISDKIEMINYSRFKNTCQYYLIYITNLTNDRIDKIINGLRFYQAFYGYFDFNYSSLLKTYISNIIGQRYFILKKDIIVLSPYQEYNEENINTAGHDFSKYGFKIKSISETNYQMFLSYKIERPYFDIDVSDQLFSLSAIANVAKPLKNFQIVIDDKKFEYLQTKKEGSMNASLLKYLNKTEIEKILTKKIENNYIFNLSFTEEHNIIKFNTIIEIENENNKSPFKYLVSLEYIPNKNRLRIITMY